MLYPLSLVKNTDTSLFSEIDGSNIKDEPVIISEHNDDNDTGAPQGDDDANADEDEDNQGNAVAGPMVLAHVDMAKMGCKYII
jgi:hypothetical protein